MPLMLSLGHPCEGSQEDLLAGRHLFIFSLTRTLSLSPLTPCKHCSIDLLIYRIIDITMFSNSAHWYSDRGIPYR